MKPWLCCAVVVGCGGRASEPEAPVAHVEEVDRGLVAWERSCAAPRDGLCVREISATPERCGDGSPVTVVVARDPARVERARRDLLDSGDPAARLALADLAFEAYMARTPPRLDAEDPEFAPWIERLFAEHDRVVDGYRAVVVPGAPAWIELASQARRGQVAAWTASMLRAFEPRPGADRDHTCATVASQATVFDEEAALAFATCVIAARVDGVSDGWSALCAAGVPAPDDDQ